MTDNKRDIDPADKGHAETDPPTQPDAGQPTDSGYSPPPDVESTKSNLYRFPRRFVLLACVAALIVIYVAQWFAPQFDHQSANMVSLVAFLLFVLCVLWVSQKWFAARGQRWVVPVTTLGIIGCATACFRFDGFSGEMFPQYSWRFTPQRMELKEVSDGVGSGAVGADTIATDDSVAVAAADSSQFLGPNRTGVIAERLFSVPSDDADATELWNQGIGEGWSGFSVVGDRAVTMEQRDEMECVTCYRLADGELLWIDQHEARHQNPLGGIGPRSTPTIVDGKVYANGATGYLRCLDLQSGDLLWATDLKELAGWDQMQFDAAAPWGHASSPLVIKSLQLCVIGFGGPVDQSAVDDDGISPTDKGLIALDMNTGEERWRGGHDQFSYASPMLMKAIDQIVIVNEKTVSGHQPATGKQLWSFPWPGQTNGGANCASAMSVDDDQFIVGKGYGGGSALLKVNKPKSEWEVTEVWSSTRVLKTKFNHTCIVGDVGYALSNGSLQAVRISTGDPLWTQPRRSRSGQGQVILAGDVLVVQNETGDVMFVAADETEYRELGQLSPLSSKTWNIPTIAGRHLVVRNDRQAVCYLLPAK